jgi:uncharacterized protein (DUF433 family)
MSHPAAIRPAEKNRERQLPGVTRAGGDSYPVAGAPGPWVGSPGVCGGDARVGNRRIPVWQLVAYRNLGASDDALMSQYDPPLTRAELDAAWRYAAAHPDEMAQAIRENNEDF